MAAQETSAVADSSGPRFAPYDPRLPAPWKGLIDGTNLYYWNPETNVTQYEKPTATAALLSLPEGPAATPAQIQQITRTFSQPSVQFGQVGQALHHERHAQLVYPQASLSGHQPQQLAQQHPFQCQQQPPPQYLNMYPQHGLHSHTSRSGNHSQIIYIKQASRHKCHKLPMVKFSGNIWDSLPIIKVCRHRCHTLLAIKVRSLQFPNLLSVKVNSHKCNMVFT